MTEQRTTAPQPPLNPPETTESDGRTAGAVPSLDGKHCESLAAEAIDLTVKLLRDIARRTPEVLTYTDIEAFIMNELNPAKVMANKDRTSCYGLTALLAKARAARPEERPQLSPFQGRVAPFMEHCFGPEISADTVERYHRFIEESLELAQALGCSTQDAHMLVDYVFGRPAGKPHQEAGGVMVTLAALCLAAGLDMHAAGEDELRRVWLMIKVIREKQRKKPKGSPLPQAASSPQKTP